VRLELGCGAKPTAGFTHHDRWKHSPHVDVEFPLEQIPWPVADGECEELRAIDVFEHLKLDVQVWLDECWRVLKPGGLLTMRLPAWDNPYSYRDPTHYRVFHPESFHYWCPNAPGTVFENFGRYYFGASYAKWWSFEGCQKEYGDLVFRLRKPE
jgi:hypothetical protein